MAEPVDPVAAPDLSGPRWVDAVAELLAGATRQFPFGPQVAVWKVAGRMFCFLAPPESPTQVTLKADPADVAALCAAHDAVTPGYHMNKRHWVTVTRGGDVPDEVVAELVVDAWELVVSKLPAVRRAALLGAHQR
jgi:predicted DNA-binding protein (MmcQ/YjbR family)